MPDDPKESGEHAAQISSASDRAKEGSEYLALEWLRLTDELEKTLLIGLVQLR
jgi:hypothetical protein